MGSSHSEDRDVSSLLIFLKAIIPNVILGSELRSPRVGRRISIKVSR